MDYEQLSAADPLVYDAIVAEGHTEVMFEITPDKNQQKTSQGKES